MWKYRGQERPDFAETPGPGQESVWDFPRPPRLEASHREVVVRAGSVELARSRRALRLCETASPPTWYVPSDDVHTEHLVSLGVRSSCEWKGRALYWALRTDPQVPIAWCYPEPRRPYQDLASCYAFYPALAECRVDGERVRPQAGGFYGGWVTDDLAGPFKGEPGTGHW